ncbi:MAG: ABC transporter permease [Lachnospiraceae bacterium]|nr:ABC transporter permease [Lachnospiraceae bacterium]
MRLYKMELYKLCHKKIFKIGLICTIGSLLFFFWIMLMQEHATVDGVSYNGYKAVQVNRHITEEFKGALTDEKVKRIIERYGIPKETEERSDVLENNNFLNQFIVLYFLEGYIHDYDSYDYETGYKISDVIYSIADSDLGKVMELTGKDIIFEYYRGWGVFLNLLLIGFIFGSVIILFTISIVFASERQTGMLLLLFTTIEGKGKDVYAKIAAAFTVAVGIWVGVIIFALILSGIVYGFDGLNCYNGMVLSYLWPSPEDMIPMYYFIPITLTLSFLGIVSLCAITLCISAYCKSNFNAVVVAAICWAAPFLIAMFFDGLRGGLSYLYSTPLFMVMYMTIFNVYNIWRILPCISAVVAIFCTCIAYRKYKVQTLS